MNAFSPLCTAWVKHVKEFFEPLHGHQSKVLALFIWGAIQAKSIVLQQVAEGLLVECSGVKAASIERRLNRFLSNSRIQVSSIWNPFLALVLPYWKDKNVFLVLDVTPYRNQAQIIYVGLLQHSRVLPLAWAVMPAQEEWPQGQWEVVERLFEQIQRHCPDMICTLIADRGLTGLALVQLCTKRGWHYLLRANAQHTCERWTPQGRRLAHCPLSDLVNQVGQHYYGKVTLWQEESIETYLSAVWEKGHEAAWFLISDQGAGRQRINDYRKRMRVEATFQDLKSRGWHWEESHVCQLERIDRMLLVLFLCVWWLTHLAAACIHKGRRSRYDRADRRDKGILRLGRLYWLDIARQDCHPNELAECLLFRRRANTWTFALRF